MPAKIYPWDEWLSRDRYTLHRGKDYICSHSSMSQQIRNEASRRGISVSIEEQRESIVIIVEERGAYPCQR